MIFHIAYDIPVSFYVDTSSEDRAREIIRNKYIESLAYYDKADGVHSPEHIYEAISYMAIRNFDQAGEMYIEQCDETLGGPVHGDIVCRIWDDKRE